MDISSEDTTAGQVLVPLDGSRQALAALPVARRMAALLKAALVLLYVSERPLAREELRGALALSPEDCRDARLLQRTGTPREAIRREAQESDLLVMITHTTPQAPESGLGPVTEALLAAVPCPVLLVPPGKVGPEWNLKRVLLPQDGSPAAAAAVEPVSHLAHFAGAELLVLHVASTVSPSPGEPGSLTAPRYIDQPQHEWQAWSSEFISRMRGLCHLPEDYPLRFLVSQGQPGSEIVRHIREYAVDLVVLPWHSRFESQGARTLKAVLHNEPCPILVLRFSPPAAGRQE